MAGLFYCGVFVTIIAANKNMLSGDSRTSDDDIIMKCKKVYDVDGDFIGFAGNFQDGLAFIDWYKNKGDKPDMESFVALVLTKEGHLYQYESRLIPERIYEKHHAIGNGAQYATGCMDSGMTPEEAVAKTAKRIEGCGPPVVTLYRE